jgi:hypothetical protein
MILSNYSQRYGYDEWGLKTTKLAICTQPQPLINLQIVADFPSTTKLS